MALVPLEGIPLIHPGDDLPAILAHALASIEPRPAHGDVLVVAQKVVSKAEDRVVDLRTVTPTPRAEEIARTVGRDARLVQVVLDESTCVLRAVPGVLIVETRLGFVCANAGVDHSNVSADGMLVAMLPESPDASADRIRAAVRASTGADLGVIINDSHGRPWREGVVGVAIGSAGLAAVDDQRGRSDLFGRPLRVTTVAQIDELAAAASMLMGQADEGVPAVLVRGARVRTDAGCARDVLRQRDRDLFR